ncbi:hypothetical protein BOTBODRAFT_49114 [Botryobasidium botryosum FD-172 SS1]|uniref:Uncharacterized protein n=1 Tax=Botryobasidium botryosum (strain FD-172 SS1) TaxID=930990 RepID=A0A067M5P7_BOTB1|nr:hypothetical protein BOTBODRAFT_49114 [Botryobasidium botryosum FD-172 SS1]
MLAGSEVHRSGSMKRPSLKAELKNIFNDADTSGGRFTRLLSGENPSRIARGNISTPELDARTNLAGQDDPGEADDPGFIWTSLPIQEISDETMGAWVANRNGEWDTKKSLHIVLYTGRFTGRITCCPTCSFSNSKLEKFPTLGSQESTIPTKPSPELH